MSKHPRCRSLLSTCWMPARLSRSPSVSATSCALPLTKAMAGHTLPRGAGFPMCQSGQVQNKPRLRNGQGYNIHFLVEIGTAELPPKALRPGRSLCRQPQSRTDQRPIHLRRRRVVCLTAPSGAEGERAGWRTAEQERREARPAVAQAFDAEGKMTKAAEGWARGNGRYHR